MAIASSLLKDGGRYIAVIHWVWYTPAIGDFNSPVAGSLPGGRFLFLDAGRRAH
jgi:hypothetical protein